jgi:MFS family permease
MVLLGIGIGSALTPLTSAGVAGVAPKDAGAASGLVNVSQQLGTSLGIGILVTVFASASHAVVPPAGASAGWLAQHQLAHGVATALRGSAIFLALALVVVTLVMWRPELRHAQAASTARGDGSPTGLGPIALPGARPALPPLRDRAVAPVTGLTPAGSHPVDPQ